MSNDVNCIWQVDTSVELLLSGPASTRYTYIRIRHVAAAFGIAVVEVCFVILEFQMLVQAFPDLKEKKEREREPVKARNLTPRCPRFSIDVLKTS